MAPPTTIRGTRVLIKIEDEASPAVFSHPCLINAERGVEWRSSTNDIIVPDCADPDAPAYRELVKDSISMGVTGAGVLDNKQATITFYDAWMQSDNSKRVRVCLSDLGYWECDMKLTSFRVTGDRGGKATVDVALESDGEITAFTLGIG